MSTLSNTATSPWWLRAVRHPLSRLIVFVLAMAGLQKLFHLLIPGSGLGMDAALGLDALDLRLWLGVVRNTLPSLLAYALIVKAIERRAAHELAIRKLLPGLAGGLLLGCLLLVSAATLMAAFGAYHIVGFNSDVHLLAPFLILAVLPGVTEEILFRGMLFRVAEERLGTWIALTLSALLFGAAHFFNPNASIWTSLAIAIEAGLLLGMAYVWTRSLWFCMALHAAWNFSQGSLLGISVSGFELKGVVNATTQGPAWLSGGEFGAEGSLLTVLLCVAVSAWFTRKAIAADRIRPAFWNQKNYR